MDELPSALISDEEYKMVMNELKEGVSSSSRFVEVSAEDIENCVKSRVPKNTVKKVEWVVRLFRKWKDEWCGRLGNQRKVYKSMEEFDKSDLDLCLQFFLCEVRKVDGSKYPPQTLKEMVAMLQHYFVYTLKKPLSIFGDAEFAESRAVLDGQMKALAKEGLVLPKKRACSISRDDEELLWVNGTFGTSNPRQLLHTLIYHLGLHLSLRACQEHKDLVFGENSQLSLLVDENGIEFLRYTERMSKNKRFGLKCTRFDPKVTFIYPCENLNRCVVAMYKMYVSHRPPTASQESAFYLTPMENPQTDIWYKNVPLGIHSIEKVTKQLMSSISDGKFVSNTSLRRTCKQRLVEAGVSKEVAEKKTGRISDAADSCYVDANTCAKQMSTILYGQSMSQSSCAVEPASSSTTENSTKRMKIEADGVSNRVTITFI